MISEAKYPKVKVSEVADILGGGTPKTSKSEYWGGDIPWLSVVDFNNNFRKVEKTEKCITKLGLENCSSNILDPGQIIISARGTVGALAQVAKQMAFNQSCYGLKGRSGISDDFLYYALKNIVKEIQANTHGSVFDTITRKTFDELTIPIPSHLVQELIADFLGKIDNKIEVNNKINKTLEEIAKTIFKSWFVDYESFKYDELIESEVGLIPTNWSIYKLSDFFTVKTGKKDANICTLTGEYPFFSCSKEILKSDTYSFNGRAILVAGNGDFNVKYYDGKFEAYQRTYVLIPNNPDLTGLLYYAIKYNLPKITKGFRGSVIKFITKGNIESFTLALPNDYSKIALIFQTISNKQHFIQNQNKLLESIRDTILPKLMSGELRVPFEEETNAKVL